MKDSFVMRFALRDVQGELCRSPLPSSMERIDAASTRWLASDQKGSSAIDRLTIVVLTETSDGRDALGLRMRRSYALGSGRVRSVPMAFPADTDGTEAVPPSA